jgi:hypothetical protein
MATLLIKGDTGVGPPIDIGPHIFERNVDFNFVILVLL